MRVDDLHLRSVLESPGGAWRSETGLRDSAVLVPLVERGGRDLLVFNRRRDDLPWHAGQVCFPGGARECDEDPVRCALREAGEEMGFDPATVTVLGRLPDRVSIAGFLVAPLVGRLDPAVELHAHAGEVAEVFEVPFADLLVPARWSFRPSSHPLARFTRIPFFDAGTHVVWGLTGIVLRDFVRTVAGFDPPDPGS